jgi:hypothetical protein
MFVVTNTGGGRAPQYELYVSDGTLSPHPTRNYHNIDASIPPRALFPLAIYQLNGTEQVGWLKAGNTILFRNVRSKIWKEELELAWSELITDDLVKAGWETRKLKLIGKDDDRAKVIERYAALPENAV